jgi:hypothetical protein
MKKLYAICIALVAPLLNFSQYNNENLSITNRPKLGEMEKKMTSFEEQTAPFVEYGHLRLYPIFANAEFVNQHRDLGKFTTLREAQDKKLVSITEHVGGSTAPVDDEDDNQSENGDAINISNNDNNNNQNRNNNEVVQIQRAGLSSSETVNTLFIQNISSDTVYIMAGEVVKGGKQDRVIAQDMILPPNSDKIDISVFCVEHGRWTYKSGNSDFQSAKYFAPAKVRASVDVEKSQSAVWSDVSANNVANGTTTSTDALTANENNDKFQGELKTYLENAELKALPVSWGNVVGVVAVSGKGVIACDIFATPQLFQSQYEPLLHSYASEAVTSGSDVTMTQSEVKAYLDSFLSDESTQDESLKGSGNVVKMNINGKEVKTRMSKY